MNWEQQLEDRIDAIGSNPTDAQMERLESWVINNVPQAFWGRIAFQLPGGLATDISMRAGECGYC